MILNDCYDIGGCCIKCPKCGCTTIDNKLKSSIEGLVIEESQHCHDCKYEVGYWVAGHYNPYYSEIYMINKRANKQMFIASIAIGLFIVIIILKCVN